MRITRSCWSGSAISRTSCATSSLPLDNALSLTPSGCKRSPAKKGSQLEPSNFGSSKTLGICRIPRLTPARLQSRIVKVQGARGQEQQQKPRRHGHQVQNRKELFGRHIAIRSKLSRERAREPMPIQPRTSTVTTAQIAIDASAVASGDTTLCPRSACQSSRRNSDA